MSGKHKNPIAAVYMMTCLDNGKIYIGETGDLLNRMSSHRNVHRRKKKNIQTKIEKAIVKHGYNNFITSILVDSKTDNKLFDNEYRRKLEAEYIEKYDSTNPDIGYNTMSEYHTYAAHSFHGHKLETESKLKLSKPIIVYTIKNKSTMMYTSANSYRMINGISDKSIITAATKIGRTIYGNVFFKLDINDRENDIKRIIDNSYSIYINSQNFNSNAIRKIKNYIIAAHAVNDWCETFGFDTVNIKKILKQYPNSFISMIT